MKKNKKNRYSDIDFEISFCENLIKEKPDFIEALILLGDNYTKKGLYKEGLKIDKRLSKLRPADPNVHYNLACSYSLLGMKNPALRTLKKAVELGYTDFRYMKEDSDLDGIKKDPRYKMLVLKCVKDVNRQEIEISQVK